LPWRYESVLHEYVTCDRQVIEGKLDGLVVHHLADSARNKLTDKYLRDALLLEDALLSEPNNARYRFFLAQSYKDADQPERALEHYLRRADMRGWDEEAWVALFEAASLQEQLKKDWRVIFDAYLRAYEYRPCRAEPLCELARNLREREHFAEAYVFAKAAATTPIPDEELLFLDRSVYEWRALDELAVAAHYLGKTDEAAELCERLLASSTLPTAERSRVEENLHQTALLASCRFS
jgi:hypothetical protein